MKRIISVALVTGLLSGAMVTPAVASWRSKECRFGSLGGAPDKFNRTEVRKTIWCASNKWAPPGGVRMALCIAGRESGLNENAQNPYSSASGVFQYVDGTWRSVRFSWLNRFASRYGLSTSVFNGRANAMLGVRHMSLAGLGAWGGGCA